MCLLLNVGALDKTKDWGRLSHIKGLSLPQSEKTSLWPNRTDFQPRLCCWPTVSLEDWPAPSSPRYRLHCPLGGTASFLCPAGPRDCWGVQGLSKAFVSADTWVRASFHLWVWHAEYGLVIYCRKRDLTVEPRQVSRDPMMSTQREYEVTVRSGHMLVVLE